MKQFKDFKKTQLISAFIKSGAHPSMGDMLSSLPLNVMIMALEEEPQEEQDKILAILNKK